MSKAIGINRCIAVFLQMGITLSGISILSTASMAQITDSSGRQLDEITVTAQKKGRAENLQEVPISITAFTGDDLDARFFQNLTSLSYTIPNVQLEEVGTFPGVQNFSIRGQGINSSIPSVDPTVGLFIDGIYMGTTFGTVIDMWDLQDVEVLRGPQGLLFGRNVTGGAVTVRTARPDPGGELGFRTRVSGTNEESYNISAVIEGPLVQDKFAAKLMVHYSEDKGYFPDPTVGRNVGKLETTVVRPSFVWTPTNSLELVLIAESGKTEGDAAAWTSVTAQRNGTLPEFTTTLNQPGETDIDWNQLTFELNWEIGPGVLTNITGWREVDAYSTPDVDGIAASVFFVPGDTEQDQFSNELRWAGTLFDDVWDMTAGVYYLTQDIDYKESRIIQGGAVNLALGGRMESDTYGIFWNNDIRFAESWVATAGIRYSKEDKEAEIITAGCFDIVDFNCTYLPHEGDWDNWTPKLGLQWEFADSAQVYGFWTKGFRAGGFNFRNARPDLIPPGPTRQEEQKMYEVGIKSELFDNRLRLNLAYFHTDIDDIQRELNLPDPTVVVLQGTINAGDATIKGIELDFTGVLGENFTYTGTVGYMDGRYTRKDPMWAPFLGNDLPRLAPWSFSLGAAYDFNLTAGSIVNVRADYGWRDRNAYNDSNTQYFEQQKRLGASVSWISPEDHWQVSLFGKNLLDEANWGNLTEIPTSATTFYVAGPMQRGREYGLELQYRL